MKTSLWLLVALLIGCEPAIGDGFVTLTETPATGAYPLVDAVYVPYRPSTFQETAFGLHGNGALLLLSGNPKVCRQLLEKPLGDMPQLLIRLARLTAKGEMTPADAPATFPGQLFSNDGTYPPGLAALVSEIHPNGGTAFQIVPTGSVTVDSEQDGVLTGSFDLLQTVIEDSDDTHFKGTFKAAECTPLGDAYP